MAKSRYFYLRQGRVRSPLAPKQSISTNQPQLPKAIPPFTPHLLVTKAFLSHQRRNYHTSPLWGLQNSPQL
ncbi:hypothetical protein ACEYW6_19465 [Nostoc sp. UIC 10607]|uniref:hypothetical protein n=1 Tax=Nostoc sp. UIC 10607 TaxID=3045935 RepID=UPI0039A0D7A2